MFYLYSETLTKYPARKGICIKIKIGIMRFRSKFLYELFLLYLNYTDIFSFSSRNQIEGQKNNKNDG